MWYWSASMENDPVIFVVLLYTLLFFMESTHFRVG